MGFGLRAIWEVIWLLVSSSKKRMWSKYWDSDPFTVSFINDVRTCQSKGLKQMLTIRLEKNLEISVFRYTPPLMHISPDSYAYIL